MEETVAPDQLPGRNQFQMGLILKKSGPIKGDVPSAESTVQGESELGIVQGIGGCFLRRQGPVKGKELCIEDRVETKPNLM